ncbi:hypothetical protein CR513_25325, partial [Mucuna pruriens]
MTANEGDPIFLKANNASDEIKNKHYMIDKMTKVIKEVGEENVVQTILDNAFNICVAKNSEKKRNFIMTHPTRLSIFNHFSPIKLLAITETCFGLVIVILKRSNLLKNVGKAQAVKEFILNDIWWDKIAYILNFTILIRNMLKACDADSPTFHLVYEMRGIMIEKVKASIYRHDGKEWTKSCTLLHCLTHSLNPRYYSDEWLQEVSNRIPPREEEDISMERKCLKKKMNALEYANFSLKTNNFASFDSTEDKWTLDPKFWWVMHCSFAPLLQKLSLRLFVQPTSSFVKEIGWKNTCKRVPRCGTLVKMHGVALMMLEWGSFDDVGILEVTSLPLDEPEIEVVLFIDDGQGGDEIDTVPISRQ